MELRYSVRARRDLLDGSIGWSVHHPGKPELFDEEIAKAFEHLRVHPRLGRATRRYKNGRVLVVVEIEQLLFYRVHRSYIAVLAVLPGRAQRTSLGASS